MTFFAGFLAVLHLTFLGTLLGNMLYMGFHRRRARAWKAKGPLPRISVMIPARNEAHNIGRLMDSLIAQSYPDFEVIVYDDGSEDATPDVLSRYSIHPNVHVMRGEGPPAGWLGKVHALYQATRNATGERFLFLDADAELRHPESLFNLLALHDAQPGPVVLTGMPWLGGSGGRLLVSLVPNAIVGALPWPLVKIFQWRSLGAMNGQVWMLRADLYRQHEPHLAVKNEILEDVTIGRNLLQKGIVPVLAQLKDDVNVYMYRDFAEAWNGFRKNAYLILGGSPSLFFVLFPFYLLLFVIPPFVHPALLLGVFAMKWGTDRVGRFPWWTTALAPLAYILGAFLAVDSSISHARKQVDWKGRNVKP